MKNEVELVVRINIEELAFAISQQLRTFLMEQNLKQEPPAPSIVKYLTRRETAEKLRISLPTLNDYTKKGFITSYNFGVRVLYKNDEIEKFLLINKIEPIITRQSEEFHRETELKTFTKNKKVLLYGVSELDTLSEMFLKLEIEMKRDNPLFPSQRLIRILKGSYSRDYVLSFLTREMLNPIRNCRLNSIMELRQLLEHIGLNETAEKLS
jgi:hypothetical protein